MRGICICLTLELKSLSKYDPKPRNHKRTAV